jgi:hypothetical protein
MKDIELLVGELPVFINNDYDGIVGKAHIRMREGFGDSTILITCKHDAAEALADMMLHNTPIALSFSYIANKPS